MDIVFSPKLKDTILPYLGELIKDHENLFRKLFPDINVINKHHHLTHYSECIAYVNTVNREIYGV